MDTIRITCEAAQLVPLERLRVLQGDLKSLSTPAYKQLRAEILERGFSFALHVWPTPNWIGIDDLGLLDGTQRYFVLMRMREEGYHIPPLPAVTVEAADEKEALLKLLAGAGMYGKPEALGLLALMKKHGLSPDDIPNISLPGINLPDFARANFQDETDGDTDGDEDSVPNPRADPIAKPDDLWLLGDHRLLVGDCTDLAAVTRLTCGETVQCVFTSPPYGDLRDYGGGNVDPVHLAKFIDVWPAKTFYVNLGIIIRDREIVPYWMAYLDAAREKGLKLLAWNVWDKGSPSTISNQNSMFGLCHEWIFAFGEYRKLNLTERNKSAGIFPVRSHRERDGSTPHHASAIVREFRQSDSVTRMPSFHGLPTGHPAPFPVELPEKYILAATEEGDVVADPFLGSGTTLMACEKNKRRCVAMESHAPYADVVLERYYKTFRKIPVREDGFEFIKRPEC